MALNILVVDDSSVMRAIIIETLRLSGLPLAEVHQASNGKEAIELMGGKWLDLVLTDINMPVMNGEQMIDELRARPETADIPIIVISTESSQTRVQALKSKGVQFLHKPFTPEGLREIVVNMTGVTLDEQATGEGFVQGGGLDF